MERICVYTCIAGDYDELKEVIVKEKGIDYICFTNNKKITSKSWKIIYIEDKNLDNHYLSRKIKMLGHPYIDENYDLSIWIDASIIFKKSVIEFLDEYFDLDKGLLASCKHFARNSIKEEAEVCIRYQKDSKDKINKLLSFYEKEHFQDDLGLLEMTLIIKRHKDPLVKKTMNLWFNMILKYSKRDQLSFMYCLSVTKLPFIVIPLDVWHNDYIDFTPHKKEYYDYKYQVYYAYSDEFNEVDSEVFNFLKKDDCYIANIKIDRNVNKLRIDLAETKDICFEIVELNGMSKDELVYINFILYKDKLISCNNDPQIILNRKIKKYDQVSIKLRISILGKEEYFKLLKEVIDGNYDKEIYFKNKITCLENENQNLKKEISSILNSYSWKITVPLRKIFSKVKKK